MKDLRRENQRLRNALEDIKDESHWTTVHKIIDTALNPPDSAFEYVVVRIDKIRLNILVLGKNDEVLVANAMRDAFAGAHYIDTGCADEDIYFWTTLYREKGETK